MKHLIIDADGICYKGAYRGEEIEAIQYINEKMDEIWANCCRYVLDMGSCLETRDVYVETWESKPNFRKWVASDKKYKGNRTGGSVDKHYVDMCKKHMVAEHAAKVCTYHESEDSVHILANKLGRDNCIIVYEDKDVLQKAGTYYNYTKCEFITLTEEQALYRLWRQVATGDSTDNITGCPGIGSRNVFFTNVLDRAQSKHYCKLVAGLYKDNSKFARNPHKQKSSYSYFIEQCRLIYLLSNETDVWLPLTKEEWDQLP